MRLWNIGKAHRRLERAKSHVCAACAPKRGDALEPCLKRIIKRLTQLRVVKEKGQEFRKFDQALRQHPRQLIAPKVQVGEVREIAQFCLKNSDEQAIPGSKNLLCPIPSIALGPGGVQPVG